MSTTAEQIIAADRAGKSAAVIADELKCTVGNVYYHLRRQGRSRQEATAERTAEARATLPCTHEKEIDLDGYRVVTTDGRVQSCWSRGRYPKKTDHWRDLAIQVRKHPPHGLALSVIIGSTANKTRTQPSLLRVYLAAFGTRQRDKAEKLLERVRKQYEK